jgi:hypothetical protein
MMAVYDGDGDERLNEKELYQMGFDMAEDRINE